MEAPALIPSPHVTARLMLACALGVVMFTAGAWGKSLVPWYVESRWGSVVGLEVLVSGALLLGGLEIQRLRRMPERMEGGAHWWLAGVIAALLLHLILWRGNLFVPRVAMLPLAVLCGIGWLGGWALIRRFLVPLLLLLPIFLPAAGLKAYRFVESFYDRFPLPLNLETAGPNEIRRWHAGGVIWSVPLHGRAAALVRNAAESAPQAGTVLVGTLVLLHFRCFTSGQKRMILTAGGALVLLCAWLNGLTNDC